MLQPQFQHLLRSSRSGKILFGVESGTVKEFGDMHKMAITVCWQETQMTYGQGYTKFIGK